MSPTLHFNTIQLSGLQENTVTEFFSGRDVADANELTSTSVQAKCETGQIFAVELRKITTELFNRKELKLHDNGPDNIDPARLAGAGMDDDEDDDDDKLDEPVEAEDLICVDIDPRDTVDRVR
ncbi:hypothetical protein COL940_007419 [Colletotrichum noveboracense]|nr:hypothetical protein COL940_007419 [Colletotrichum noveboracense]